MVRANSLTLSSSVPSLSRTVVLASLALVASVIDLLFSHHFHASVHCTCVCKSTITFFNLLIIIDVNITKCDMDAEYIGWSCADVSGTEWMDLLKAKPLSCIWEGLAATQHITPQIVYLAVKFVPEPVFIILWSRTGHMENNAMSPQSVYCEIELAEIDAGYRCRL